MERVKFPNSVSDETPEEKEALEKLSAKVEKLFRITPRQREARRKRHVKQQRKWGFCDSELWNFYSCIVTFILPRLIRFRKMPKMGYPASLSEKRWDRILDRMIAAFETIKKGAWTKKEIAIVQRGLKLFAEHFQDLWD